MRIVSSNLRLGSLHLKLSRFRTQRALVTALQYLVKAECVEPIGRCIAVGNQVAARSTQIKSLRPKGQRRIGAHGSDEALRTRVVHPIAGRNDGQIVLH